MEFNLEEIKKDILTLIDSENFDNDKLLTLVNQFAQQDQSKVRFTIDASHINRLGLELVSKQETAVAELVKNGYDADATNLDIIFKNIEQPGGSIEVIDNGNGMTRQELIDGFMRISTAGKVDNPVSRKFGRKRAGRKGIGRFSAQRLGSKLILTTQTESEPFALRVSIDWDAFEAHRDLSTISSTLHVIEQQPNHGTTLLIENVRDAWTEVQIKRAFKFVSSLLSPFVLEKRKVEEGNIDPGFKTGFYREENNEIVKIIDEDEAIFDHALAIIEGHVDEEGTPYWSLTSRRLNIELKDVKLDPNPSFPYSSLIGTTFKAYYFIADTTLISKGYLSLVRDYLREYGGIRLYRNGFRVHPYGERFDDWLKLERSSALRMILPPHHNANFLGFVSVTDDEGRIFQETSSREGLIENPSFDALRDYLYKIIKAAVLKIAEVRLKKGISSQEYTPKESSSPSQKAKQLVEIIEEKSKEENAQKQKSQSGGECHSDSAYNEKIKQGILELGKVGEDLLEEIGMLRVLASLGLTIGEFTHEVRHSLAALVANIKLLSSYLDPKVVATKEILDSAESNLLAMQAYAQYFDRAIQNNVHRKLEVQEVRDIIHIFKKVADPLIKREQIELTEEIVGYQLFTRPMHNSEWASILLNLLTNSAKAIKKAQVEGKVHIKAGEDGDHLFIEFSDNGTGIPPEHHEEVFDAFFTTTSPAGSFATESEELTGTGLGLKIVKDIVESSEGEIYVTSPPEGYMTCFRIEIPKASEEEIPEDAY